MQDEFRKGRLEVLVKALPELQDLITNGDLRMPLVSGYTLEQNVLQYLLFEAESRWVNPLHMLEMQAQSGSRVVTEAELEHARAISDKIWHGKYLSTLSEILEALCDDKNFTE